MSGYYAYIIGADGHIRNRVDIVIDDETEALRCAKQLVDGHAVELREQSRKVATLEPDPPVE
jgi:hypothetical protein